MKNKKLCNINIKGTIYTVFLFDDERSYLGLAETLEKNIYISTNGDIRRTIAHELMHCYFYECGLSDFCSNEILVDFIALTIFDLIKSLNVISDKMNIDFNKNGGKI